MHLVSREALRLYESKLAPGGVMAFHISNRKLDLKPVFANLAHDVGLAGILAEDFTITPPDAAAGKVASLWVVMARTQEELAPFVADPRWKPLRNEPGAGVWTDDFSNILGAIVWKR
jgi:hypothetical protein